MSLGRRTFLALTAATLWPRFARGQPARPLPRIAWFSTDREPDPFLDGFREGLRRHGYVEGEHVVLEDAATLEPIDTGGRTIMELERDVILSTLARLNGNRTHTAKALGITVRTIRNRLRKYRTAAAPPEPPSQMAS